MLSFKSGRGLCEWKTKMLRVVTKTRNKVALLLNCKKPIIRICELLRPFRCDYTAILMFNEQTGPRFLANWLNHDQNFLKKAREKQRAMHESEIRQWKKKATTTKKNERKERKEGTKWNNDWSDYGLRRERERDRGEEKHAEKVKDFGSRKQVIFPKLKLNFAGDCFWLLILFSYEKMWEPSTFLNFRLSLVYLLSGTCFHILNHAIF